MPGPAIGIDLGTTYSCVAVLREGKVETIANDQGNRTTPSYVAFTDTGRLVGDSAKNQAAANAGNTVFDAKRLIGRGFKDGTVQADKKFWPFVVVNDVGRPKIQVTYKGEPTIFCAEEILAMILGKMKKTAEDYLGMGVQHVVVTVPVYYNASQRQAIRNAATIAGLTTYRVISSPVAAAVAYALKDRQDKNPVAPRNVLIFDLGGGTLSVSVFILEDGIIEVQAVSGDSHLGGQDFDQRMVNHFAQEFKRVHSRDITGNKRAMLRLRAHCERAKHELSSSTQTAIQIDNLLDGIDFHSNITRARFEELNRDLFAGIIEPVERVLRDAKLGKAAIEDIVLVGGSTRIPKIQKVLLDFFDGREIISKGFHPDETAAHGAAIQAAILHGGCSTELQDLLLLDAVPLSLGVGTLQGVMNTLIKRNTTIPTKQTIPITSTYDNGVASILIYEGERAMTKDNHFLGTLELSGIQPAPAEVTIEVTMDIDGNSTNSVSAVEKSSGISDSITIPNGRDPLPGGLTQEQIQRMAQEVEQCMKDDEERIRTMAKSVLESCALLLKNIVGDLRLAPSAALDKTYVLHKCEDVLCWLKDNQTAGIHEYQQKKARLETVCLPIIGILREDST